MVIRLLFVLIFSWNFAFANRQVIDSLSVAAKKIALQKPSLKRDTSLIWALTYLTYNCAYFREPSAKFYLDSLISFTDKTSWKEGKALAKICQSSVLFWTERDIDMAYEYATEAQAALNQSHDDRALAWSNLRLTGLLLWQSASLQNSFQNGLFHARKVTEHAIKIDDKDLIALGLAYEANHLHMIGKNREALKKLNEAENFDKQSQLGYFAKTNIYGTMAGIHAFLGNYEQTLHYIEKNLLIGKIQEDYYLLTSMYEYKGGILALYGRKKNISEGIKFLQEAHQYAKKLNDLKVLARVENSLYKAYKLSNQDSKALAFLELEKAHLDSLNSKNTQKIYADYQLYKKENDFKTLENEKLQVEATKNKWIRNLLIISLLVGFGFLLYFLRTNKILRKYTKDIEEALFKGQTIERKRVAADLHDNLSAKISGVRLRLEAIEPTFPHSKHHTIYQSSINALSEIYTDIRLISHNLLPADLETRGLKVALEHFIKELNEANTVNFTLNMSDSLQRYSNKIEYEVFSIILELSNNIMKHSKATIADINLSTINNFLHLEVKDNGVGLENNLNGNGMGLKNVKSRVDSLNGKLDIINDKGLTIRISLPSMGN